MSSVITFYFLPVLTLLFRYHMQSSWSYLLPFLEEHNYIIINMPVFSI